MDQYLAIGSRCYREVMCISADDYPVELHLLSSNYAPTDAEASQTLTLIEEEERALAACISGIANFRWVLEDLIGRKSILKERIKQRRAAVSVTRRIPVELWVQIFARLYSMTEDEYPLTLHTSQGVWMAPAIALSQVCSRWRGILLSTPALWTSIDISLSSLPPSSQRLLELYLRNSKQHPLHVKLQGGNYYARIHAEAVETLRDTIMTHIHRSESLSCHHFGKQFVIPEGSLSNLIALTDNSRDRNAQWQAAFKDAPRLTSVTSSFLYPLHDLPYHQLTSLECRNLLHRDVEKLARQVLPSCGELESLTLRDPGVDDSRTDSSRCSSRSRLENVPNLRSFSITFSVPDDPIDVTSPIHGTILSIKASALTTLRLNFSQGQAEGWATVLVDFLAQTSSTSLRSLSLSIVHSSIPHNQTLSGLLQAVPNLVEFELALDRTRASTLRSAGRWAYQDFLLRHIGNFFHDIQSTTLFPKLTNISFSAMNHMILTNDFVNLALTAAESRTSTSLSTGIGAKVNIDPLAHVQVICRRLRKGKATGHWETFALSSEARQRIRNLSRSGVRVVMEGHNEMKSTSVGEFSTLDAYSTSIFAT
ncbi:hypothetical protein AAF712_009614 [Marasmius tenuissimus]|uniref:F-box domain-containing protein n=1 Tax=Marasmius tenuissimus TaxID=585030 RepID=A0ABR2ZQW5_9AGAR